MSRLLSAPDDEKRDDSQKEIITFWIGEGKSPPVMDTNWGKEKDFYFDKRVFDNRWRGKKIFPSFFSRHDEKKAGNPVVSRKRGERVYYFLSPPQLDSPLFWNSVLVGVEESQQTIKL